MRSSFTERVGGANAEQQAVRINTINIVHGDWKDDPSRLLFGEGIGSGGRYLVARGGNAKGYTIFDNQYATSLYDMGLIVLLVFIVLVGSPSSTAPPRDGWRGCQPWRSGWS